MLDLNCSFNEIWKTLLDDNSDDETLDNSSLGTCDTWFVDKGVTACMSPEDDEQLKKQIALTKPSRLWGASEKMPPKSHRPRATSRVHLAPTEDANKANLNVSSNDRSRPLTRAQDMNILRSRSLEDETKQKTWTMFVHGISKRSRAAQGKDRLMAPDKVDEELSTKSAPSQPVAERLILPKDLDKRKVYFIPSAKRSIVSAPDVASATKATFMSNRGVARVTQRKEDGRKQEAGAKKRKPRTLFDRRKVESMGSNDGKNVRDVRSVSNRTQQMSVAHLALKRTTSVHSTRNGRSTSNQRAKQKSMASGPLKRTKNVRSTRDGRLTSARPEQNSLAVMSMKQTTSDHTKTEKSRHTSNGSENCLSSAKRQMLNEFSESRFRSTGTRHRSSRLKSIDGRFRSKFDDKDTNESRNPSHHRSSRPKTIDGGPRSKNESRNPSRYSSRPKTIDGKARSKSGGRHAEESRTPSTRHDSRRHH